MGKNIELEKFSLFTGIPAERTAHLSRHFTPVQIAKRQQLHLKEELEDAIYFISEGRIKISYFTEDGKEFIVTVLGPGDIYSFHSEATATAMSDSLVWLLSMNDLKKLVLDFPVLNFKLFRLLGGILKQYNDLVLNLAFKEVSSRLAGFLLEQSAEGTWIKVGLTHEDIALHLGSTRQTVTSTLRRWERQGIVELRRGAVKVLKQYELSRLV